MCPRSVPCRGSRRFVAPAAVLVRAPMTTPRPSSALPLGLGRTPMRPTAASPGAYLRRTSELPRGGAARPTAATPTIDLTRAAGSDPRGRDRANQDRRRFWRGSYNIGDEENRRRRPRGGRNRRRSRSGGRRSDDGDRARRRAAEPGETRREHRRPAAESPLRLGPQRLVPTPGAARFLEMDAGQDLDPCVAHLLATALRAGAQRAITGALSRRDAAILLTAAAAVVPPDAPAPRWQ